MEQLRRNAAGRHLPTAFEFVVCASEDRHAINSIMQALKAENIDVIRSRAGDAVELIAPIRHRDRAAVIATSILARRQRVKDAIHHSDMPDGLPPVEGGGNAFGVPGAFDVVTD